MAEKLRSGIIYIITEASVMIDCINNILTVYRQELNEKSLKLLYELS